MLASGPPRFDLTVPRSGYAWWYLDALSDDGRHGLVVIAFIGSVFSPYYACSKVQDPYDHVAINVALYGRPGAWAMTERGRRALAAEQSHFQVANSSLNWRDGGLDVHVDTVCAPIPRPLKGRIRVEAPVLANHVHVIEAEGGHVWRPIAPAARVEVSFATPRLQWSGAAYVDANAGEEPLGAGFRSWDWRRAPNPDGGADIHFDAERRRGGEETLSLRHREDGSFETIPSPPRHELKRGLWGVRRRVRSDGPVQLVRVWEDTPFYTRSEVRLGDPAADRRAVAESLDMDRFAAPWVRALLPFRMPRFA